MATEELASRRCEACEAGTPPLGERRAKELHAQLDTDWKLSGDHLERLFGLENFRDAFALASKIADLAESEGHHPDLLISWGKVVVTLKTHSIGGLSDNDFIMAAKIDRLEFGP